MIVYSSDKQTFLSDVDNHEIDDVILQKFKTMTGRGVGKAEMQSWRVSLSRMASVLRDHDIPLNVGVAIEFHIPQSSKRIDMTLTGRGEDNSKNAVIVELKQWETAKATKKDAIVSTFVGGAVRETVHPSYQAWSYATLLEGFNTAIYNGDIKLRPCAFLHNYLADGHIDSEFYKSYTDKAPLFLKGDSEKTKLREFIKTHVKHGDDEGILQEIEDGKIRPSKALADSLSALMKGNAEFILIDEQKAVYESAIAAAQSASTAVPRVQIVEGGPGTGKSVLAINLLVALTAKGLVCKYVSRNAAPRAVFQSKLTGSLTRTKYESLFSGSGSFRDIPHDSYDVLIVDEAHRLNEKSGLYGNLGENQIKEIIDSAKCTVFFVDEDQRVTLKDVGSKDQIRGFAESRGAVIEDHVLSSQFRCSGSDGYLAWVDNTLQVRETANNKLTTAEYDFRVFDSPVEMHRAIEQRNGNNKARVVGGYCWKWTSKADPKKFDINIGGDYHKRWNLADDGSLWIITPSSIDEVGCIHTCQGLEVDYIGVIIGPDLIVRDGKVQTDATARSSQDRSIQGYKKWVKAEPEAAKQQADLIIKNTYRTLMTRGMKGCFVYCTDAETREYFRSALLTGGVE